MLAGDALARMRAAGRRFDSVSGWPDGGSLPWAAKGDSEALPPSATLVLSRSVRGPVESNPSSRPAFRSWRRVRAALSSEMERARPSRTDTQRRPGCTPREHALRPGRSVRSPIAEDGA